MEDNEYKNSFPSVAISKESVLSMLSKVAGFKMQERDLALDRFKRVNEDMSEDDFWIQGKTAILYLEAASKSSNYLGDMAKDVMKIVFKEDAPAEGGAGNGLSDDEKKRLSSVVESHLKDKRKKEQDQHKLTYNSETEPTTDKDPE